MRRRSAEGSSCLSGIHLVVLVLIQGNHPPTDGVLLSSLAWSPGVAPPTSWPRREASFLFHCHSNEMWLRSIFSTENISANAALRIVHIHVMFPSRQSSPEIHSYSQSQNPLTCYHVNTERSRIQGRSQTFFVQPMQYNLDSFKRRINKFLKS